MLVLVNTKGLMTKIDRNKKIVVTIEEIQKWIDENKDLIDNISQYTEKELFELAKKEILNDL